MTVTRAIQAMIKPAPKPAIDKSPPQYLFIYKDALAIAATPCSLQIIAQAWIAASPWVSVLPVHYHHRPDLIERFIIVPKPIHGEIEWDMAMSYAEAMIFASFMERSLSNYLNGDRSEHHMFKTLVKLVREYHQCLEITPSQLATIRAGGTREGIRAALDNRN